jgi:hypothetical protein
MHGLAGTLSLISLLCTAEASSLLVSRVVWRLFSSKQILN